MRAPKDAEFGRRFFNAWKDLEKSEGDAVSLAEIGKRVAAVLRRVDAAGRVEPYSHATVHAWRSGTRPEAPVIRAIETVLGCPENYLLRTQDGDGRGGRRVGGGRR